MSQSSSIQITEMLHAWEAGDREALSRIMPLVYQELHRLARRYMSRERAGHTLQTSALVNEAYLKLADQKNVHWQNRSQFFGIAAQMMRRILVDHARARNFAKRGAGAIHVSLTEATDKAKESAAEVIALDEALNALEQLDRRQSRVVELRFFGGMTIDETAAALGVSTDTVKREWCTAKAWLYHRLAAE